MWDISNVEKHNKGLTDKQKAQWVAIANSVLSKCKKDGGTDATCALSAIRQANGVVDNSQVNINFRNDTYQIREETYQSKEYIVVPVTMMVEGVHNGSHGALLHTISELGKFPSSWDGIPIVIDHPQVEGMNVSANSPRVIDSVGVGQVFETNVDGSRLKAEAWLDKNKLIQVSPEVFNNLQEGKMLEVSVGVFTDNESVSGEWNGEQYNKIAKNHRPDHLALLPGGTGACSIEDGCGIRLNKKKGGKLMNENAEVTGMETKRQKLGISVAEFYAIPRDPPSESKLPIFDAVYVRNALERFNQVQGASAEEKASAKRKILAKAKHFGIDVTNLSENKLDAQSYEDLSVIEFIDDNMVVYEKMIGDFAKMYKQGYQTNEKGEIELTGSPVEVKRQYIDVGRRKIVRNNFKPMEVETMSNENVPCGHCMEKVVAIIQSNAAGMTEENRVWLLTQDEATLDILLSKKVAKQPEVNANAKPEVQALSDEDKADLAWAKAQRKANRENLIKGIQANVEKDTWSDAELNVMNETILQKIYNSVKKEEVKVDYSLNGNRVVDTNAIGEEPLYPAGIEMEIKK